MSWLIPHAGMGAAPAFPTITGLLAHYDAALGVTKDGSDNVSQWDDQSGNGYHLTTPDTDPVWYTSLVNGLPGIRFNGSSDYMTKTGVTAFDDPHVYMVANSVSHTAGDLLWYLWKSGVSLTLEQTGSAPSVRLWGNGAYIATTTGGAVGTWHLSNACGNGSSDSFYQLNNDTKVQTATGGAITDLTVIALAANTSGTVEGNIEVAELVIYSEAANTPITGGDDTLLKDYFSAKYGVF